MVGPAVHVAGVTALAVRRLVQLERRVRADILDVVGRITLVGTRVQ